MLIHTATIDIVRTILIGKSVTHNLESWRLRTKVYHKTDDFSSRCEFSIHSNIAAAPAYGVHCIYLSVNTTF
jgi:hypothetical protein